MTPFHPLQLFSSVHFEELHIIASKRMLHAERPRSAMPPRLPSRLGIACHFSPSERRTPIPHPAMPHCPDCAISSRKAERNGGFLHARLLVARRWGPRTGAAPRARLQRQSMHARLHETRNGHGVAGGGDCRASEVLLCAIPNTSALSAVCNLNHRHTTMATTVSQQHPLKAEWCFWYVMKQQHEDYMRLLTPICSFNTVRPVVATRSILPC
jgi:hypothetical protein